MPHRDNSADERIAPRLFTAALVMLLTFYQLANADASGMSRLPAATVRGQVLASDGNPVPQVLVGLRRVEGAGEVGSPDYLVRSRKDGSFVIRGVKPDRYIIFANSRRYGTVLVDHILVLPGTENSVTLRFSDVGQRSAAGHPADKSAVDGHAGADSRRLEAIGVGGPRPARRI